MANRAIEFTVDAISPNINDLHKHRHWGWRHSKKLEWQDRIWAALGVKNLAILRAWAELGHRVSIVMTVHHKQEADPDNLKSYAKIPLDAMVCLRVLRGDKRKNIEIKVLEVVGPEVKSTFKVRRIR